MGRGSLKAKNDRQSRLIGLLRAEEFTNSSLLCNELKVSFRTLMRDIQELRDAGYPIDSDRGRGGGIRLSDRWGIDKLNLDHSEVIDMLISLAITEKLNSPLLLKGLKSIRQKIARTFPPHQKGIIRDLRKRILIGDPASSYVLENYKRPHDGITKTITEGFFEGRILEFSYVSATKEPTVRQVEPHVLLLSWPVWYLAGWDYLREDRRMFRIDRISSVRKLKTKMKARISKELIAGYEEYYERL